MDEQFDLRLRRGLIELIEPELGGYPRWATSPAAERVKALAPGGSTAASPALWDRIALRQRLGSRARLAWIVATVVLLVLGLLAFAAAGGFDPRDEPRPSTPSTVEIQRSPALLAAGGFEVLTGDRGDYGQAVADADGTTLWLLADGRLSRFDSRRGTAESWTPAHDLAFTAQTIAPARQGGVWLVGAPPDGAGLRWFDGASFRDVIEAPAQLAAAAEAPDGSLWVGTTDGAVLHWDGATWSTYDDRTQQANAYLSSIAVDPSGSLWLGWVRFPQPPGAGLVERFDGVTWRTFDADDAAPLRGTIWSINPLPDGAVWVASDAGLASFDGSTWRTFAPSAGAPRLAVSVAAGSDGAVWVAAGDPDDGAVTVSRLNPAGTSGPEWTTYGPDDGLPGPNETGWITPRVLVRGDAVFAATGGGLLQLAGERWQRVWPTVEPADPGWPAALLPLSYDEAWAGTDSGLWRFRDGTWSQSLEALAPTGGVVGGVRDLEAAPDGSVWAATDSGTLRLQGDRWTVVDPQPAARLAVGPDGTVWVGAPSESEGDQLWTLRFDGASWQVTDAEDPSIAIADLAVGPDGTVWATSMAWCLGQTARYDGISWEFVDPGPGRVSAGWEVDVAQNGDAWFVLCATENGGSTVARLHGGDWTFFGESEGFYPGSWDGLSIGPDGTVWAPMTGGLWRFDGATWTSHLPGVGFDSVWVAGDGSIWAVGAMGPVRLEPD